MTLAEHYLRILERVLALRRDYREALNATGQRLLEAGLAATLRELRHAGAEREAKAVLKRGGLRR